MKKLLFWMGYRTWVRTVAGCGRATVSGCVILGFILTGPPFNCPIWLSAMAAVFVGYGSVLIDRGANAK